MINRRQPYIGEMIMKIKMLLVMVVFASLAACTFSDSFMRSRNMPVTPSNAPMIFGGQNRDIYLGNISSNQADADSIYNRQGKYGDPKSLLSISNKKNAYGGVASELSACDPHAINPPILVDKYNMVLGDFTLNPERNSALTPEISNALRKLCN